MVLVIYVFKKKMYLEKKIKREMLGDIFLSKSKYTNYSHPEPVLQKKKKIAKIVKKKFRRT